MSEHDEQRALVDWIDLQYPNILFHANINGAHLAGDARARSMQVNKLKAEGYTPGVPDIFIAEPRGGWHGCYVEMKTLTGRLSENQEQFLARAEQRGYFTIVGYGFEFARDLLNEYLSGKVRR